MSLYRKTVFCRLFLFHALAAIAITAAAQPSHLLTPTDKKVNEIAQQYMRQPAAAGLSIGILKDGKTYFYGFGETAKGNNTVPDSATIFEIGSITKTFTATLLALAVREGKLKLSDPVNKYLPDSIPLLQYNNRAVTITDLSNHSSAIPRMPSNFVQTVTDRRNPYVNYTISDLYSFLAHLQLDREPGEKFEYSNTAVGLLGVILQKLYNDSYEALIEKYICVPLDMKDTRIYILKNDSARFAKGYTERGIYTSPWDLPPAFAGAGAIRSTTADMLKYAAAQLGKAPRTLDKAMRLTHEVTFSKGTTLGLNWIYRKPGADRILFHNGATGGYKSYIGINENKKFAVVILSNCGLSVDEPGGELMKALEQE